MYVKYCISLFSFRNRRNKDRDEEMMGPVQQQKLSDLITFKLCK